MSDFEIIVVIFMAAVVGVALGYAINVTGFLDQDVMVLAKKIWRKLRRNSND